MKSLLIVLFLMNISYAFGAQVEINSPLKSKIIEEIVQEDLKRTYTDRQEGVLKSKAEYLEVSALFKEKSDNKSITGMEVASSVMLHNVWGGAEPLAHICHTLLEKGSSGFWKAISSECFPVD